MVSFSSLSDLFPRNVTFLLTVGACLATTGVSLYLLNRKKRLWVQNVAIIRNLFVYPIKSVPGVEVARLGISPTGVSYKGIDDRSVCMCINCLMFLISKLSLTQEHDTAEQGQKDDHHEA